MVGATNTEHSGSPFGTTIDTVDALIRILRRHPLLTAEEREELGQHLARKYTDPRALARELCRRGWLTPFQVNRLFRGEVEDLFLDRYVLLEALGAGGTGQVFKARHLHLGRFAAVKVIRPEFLADAQVVARFYREMRAASRLAHPHVVQAYDGGPLGGTHVLVLEFIDGPDLGRLIAETGTLCPERIFRYVRQTALGLQHIHEQGLVHRDLKPSNLLLDRSGGEETVKVLDLGLARLLTFQNGSPTNVITSSRGDMMGTVDYMAPEQATDFSGADPRADVYSLGCVCFHLLAGRPPFEGKLSQRILKHQQSEPPAVSRLRSGLPRQTDAVLARMMAKRPEDRYQTAAAAADAMATLEKSVRGLHPPRGRLAQAAARVAGWLTRSK